MKQSKTFMTALLLMLMMVSAVGAKAGNFFDTGSMSTHDKNQPIGWGASVTGSEDENQVTVTTLDELTAALTGTDKKTIIVSGTITFPGLQTFEGVKNKSIYGLPGAVFQNLTHSASVSESGIMMLKNCDNIIIRNLTFKAAGAYDIDGNDNLTLTHSTNIWVDHCDFQDGVDGNLDCNNGSDNICVSWCRFRYLITPWSGGSGGSDDHRFSNLWGGGDKNAANDEGKLNTTFVNCWWDNGCKQRMPRVRFGKVHILNCLYNSNSAEICIGAGYRCNIYAEKNVFAHGTAWQNYATASGYTDYNIKLVSNSGAADAEQSSGNIEQYVPSYTYTAMEASAVSAAVTAANGAGATLTITGDPISITWSMANGSTSTAVADPAEDILSTSWTIGSNLAIDGTETGTYFGSTYTRFTRVGDNKLDNKREQLSNSYIEFKFKPTSGLIITPSTLSFDITKIGTGDPNIWVECIQGSTTTSIAENVAIRKSSESTPSEHQSYNLTDFPAISATTGEMAIRIYIGKLANNKQVGIANVVIGGTVSGSIQTYTTVYDLAASMMTAASNFEGNSGTLAATTADDAANAPELAVDATSGKLGANNSSWAQLNAGTILTIPGVPAGAEVTFSLYNSTALTIGGVAYTNGQTYTTTADEDVVMTCTTSGYIKSITVEGPPFVTLAPTTGYTNTWQFGKSNGAEEFALEKSAEYEYTVNERSLVVNTDAGKLNNANRTDQWAQCNNGTLFKVPVYAGSKLSWGMYNSGSETGFTIDGQLFNDYYIVTEDGTVNMTATGIGYLSFIKIEPVSLYEISGTITGGDINGKDIILTAAGNGEKYTATVASNAFTMNVPADTYTPELGSDVASVVSSPATVTVSKSGSIGTISISTAAAQTVSGAIANAPAEAFTLTFTGASHTETVNCEAGATSFTKDLMPDTYTMSSSVGTLSPLSQESFTVVTSAVSHNIYFPEAAVPNATQQNITVDNTLATATANNYKTVSDALAAAKAGGISSPIITLTSGQTYREQVIVDQANVTLKTSGEEKATITFYYGIGYSYYSLGTDGYYNKDRAMTRNSMNIVNPARWGATVLVKKSGAGFKAENIVFENSFNQYYTSEEVADGVTATQVGDATITYDRTLTSGQAGYKAADTKAVTERAAAIGFENNPTGCELHNCVLRGSQDTFYTSGKIYVKKSNIIGNTDYIFGGGYVVFDDCDLTIGGYSDQNATAYITAYKDGNTLDASKRYVFRDCTVKKTDRTYVAANLGRDWGGAAASVYYFNLKNKIGSKLSYTWTNMGGGITAGTANLHIYDFDATVNANYSKTGSTGANVNGVVSDADATTAYTEAVSKLGFTPTHIYDDMAFDENSAHNTIHMKAYNGGTGSVDLTRTLPANKWATIVLPFGLSEEQITSSFGADAKVAQLTGVNETALTFSSVTTMTANEPYMIFVPEGLSEAKTISGVTITDGTPEKTTASGIDFIGSYDALTDIHATDGSYTYYFVSNNNLYKTAASNTPNTIKAFRAYFKVPGTTAARLTGFVIDDETTSISEELRAKSEESATAPVYNLKGQRVSQPKSGIYIVDGKKVIVK